MIKWRYLILPACLGVIFGLHPFLAINRPVDAKVMVIEGWIPEASLKFASHMFQNDHYDLILTNGGLMPHRSNPGADRITYAEWSKSQLIGMGIDANKIVIVNTARIDKSKTYSYARSTVDWLLQNVHTTKSFNILTLDAHARKSYILYQKAAGKQIEVGIISAPPVAYHPGRWFLSIYGIGFVVRNLFGYLLALSV